MLNLTNTLADGQRNTAGRVLKVNHAGEFGAINIYRAQIFIGSIYSANHIGLLKEFLTHEKHHLAIFSKELTNRGMRRCRSYWLCGVGGFLLGLISASLGRKSVMACTAAVELVVLNHLEKQLASLKQLNDQKAYDAVAAIIEDERSHQAHGISGQSDCIFYKPFVKIIKGCTEIVIWLGMRL